MSRSSSRSTHKAPRTSTPRSARLDARPSAYRRKPPGTSSTSPRPMPATSLPAAPRTCLLYTSPSPRDA
eukprot:2008815-Heterocapsa_arctica.AAC.1